jgi:hypothetical protein
VSSYETGHTSSMTIVVVSSVSGEAPIFVSAGEDISGQVRMLRVDSAVNDSDNYPIASANLLRFGRLQIR